MRVRIEQRRDWPEHGLCIYAEAYRSEHDARVRESKLKHHGSAKHGLMRRIEHCILKGKK